MIENLRKDVFEDLNTAHQLGIKRKEIFTRIWLQRCILSSLCYYNFNLVCSGI